ncbi:hypothetical protein [Halorubrum laminariae]|uniref:Uncharacterized protein n=1 Tax=Halorubrum laminariae TaxID=1433523 RepID=A0ABD6C1D8_9EURY|nr:hypothetical protein [Halorubrum laminariae]
MALLTDLLAVAMVALAVGGMLAVALRARDYDMIGTGEGIVVALGAALTVGMTVTTFV